MKDKAFLLILIIFALIVIPVSFANDDIDGNVTGTSNEDILEISDDDSLGDLSTVYYFDASATSDGSGTKNSPFKFLTSSRLWGGATCYFEKGQYELDSAPWMLLGSVELKGYDPLNTIIKYDGQMFTISSGTTVAIEGITISGSNFNLQGGTLSAKNAIFENSKGVSSDSYNNIWGSVVTSKSNSYSKSTFTADNSTFRNNNAEYGGVAYINGGIISISNSVFENNYATQFGGVFAGENGASITVKNSKFSNCYSQYDSGACVYVLNSKASISNSNFTMCNSFLGPVVTGLNSSVNANNIIANENEASWEGGAIYSMYGDLTVSDSTFTKNTAKNGGAVFADNLTSLKVNNCEFISNSAEDTAGAILAFANVKTEITNPTYRNNCASREDDCYDTKYLDIAIGSADYEMMQYKTYNGILPSRYDARNYGYVSSLKEQADSGNCWAYATIAALESCIMKATGIEYDLSEGNLKNHAQYYSDYGWQYETNNGGFYDMSIGYITNWLGPVLESEDLSDDYDVISPVINSLMHVQNVLYIQRSSYTDNDAIKRAVLNYGAVATEMNIVFSSQYMNGKSYYYNGNDVRNHAVIIIGWDDTYSRSNFAITPPGDGAFLIKNSYGTRWGDNGFGYVSYYDTKFAQLNAPYNTFTFILNDTIKFNKNYQYDFAGKTDYFVTGKDTIWYENVFNSTGNDLLAAFSTYFNTTTDWEAYIYVNDDLKLTQNGHTNTGYYTFNLDELIPLSAGDTFKIALKISADGFASFPISEHLANYSTSRQFYRPGVSFFSYDGVNWNDLCNYHVNESYGHKYSSQVACIKAFTTSSDIVLNTSIEITDVNSKGVTVKVLDENNNPVANGKVIFNVDGGQYSVNIKKGIATLDLDLSYGNHNVTANYTGNSNYNPSIDFGVFVIENNEIFLEISAKDIHYGQDLIIHVSVTNYKGDKLDLPVLITVDNASYRVTEDTLTVSNLMPNTYTISAIVENRSVRDTINVEVSKLYSDLKIIIDDIEYGDELIINVESNAAGNVVVKVNNESYSVLINKNKSSIKLDNIPVGSFTANGEFIENDIYSASKNSTSFKVNKADIGLIISCEDIPVGQTAVINVKFTNDATGSVIVKLNGKNYFATINDNEANVIISNLLEGNYTYTVEYNGNAYYNSVTNKSSFNVAEIKKENAGENNTNLSEGTGIILKADDVIKFYSGPERFIVHVLDSENNPLTNKAVIISINNAEYSRKTDENGSTSIPLNLNSGIYTVSVFCDDISLNSTVTIRNTIEASDLVKIFRNASQYVAQFVDGESKLIANTMVSFNINGIYYNRTTDENGMARLNINLEQGEYILTAINSITGEMHTNIVKILPNIVENEDLIKFYRNSSQYVVRVLDGDGNYKAGVNVTFNINGVFYTRTSNSTGHAQLNINLQPGEYIITAEYNSCRVSNNIKVKDVLSADNLIKKYRSNNQFIAKLVNGQGNPLAGEKITFNINGVFYNRTTDSDGLAKLNINLQSGSYIITSTYKGANIANIVTITD